MRFDPAVLAADPARRRVVLGILDVALDAVDPEQAVRNAVRRSGETVLCGDAVVSAPAIGRVFIIAFGKAAVAMARGAVRAFDGIPRAGLVAAPDPGADPAGLQPIWAGHPFPDSGSVAGGRAALDLAHRAGRGDLAVVLISGGGSALLELPAGNLALEDLQGTSDLLMRAGADIGELNTVRKHLSAVKGGRLAEALAPADIFTLILSDVAGSPPDVIASGPTVPDPSTYGDALAIIRGHGLADEVPGGVMEHLSAGAAGRMPETPKHPLPGVLHEVVVVADGAVAGRAAAAEAQRRGIMAAVVDTALAGTARDVGQAVVAASRDGSLPEMAIYAGETTVEVRGDGRGGRNQELALAAAIAAEEDSNLVVASLGTDGVDGFTDAAGAIVDGATAARGTAAGLNARAHLDRNDSYPYLAATGDLLVTGPTGTNVGDLVVSWRRRPTP